MVKNVAFNPSHTHQEAVENSRFPTGAALPESLNTGRARYRYAVFDRTGDATAEAKKVAELNSGKFTTQWCRTDFVGK